MTAKTDNFKNTQIPQWEDGDLANGANFSQLITAIAALVNDTKAETLTEAAQAVGSGYTDTQAQAVVQAFLNSEAAKQTTAYTTLKSLIDGKPTTEISTIPFYAIKSYTFSGSTVTLQKTNNTTQAITLTTGAAYLQTTTEALLAECINTAGTTFLLTRADGAKILVDSSAKTAKPAAALIG